MKHNNKILHYKPKLKLLARKLGNNMTLAEILLWQQLKNKQLCGYDFDRQKPIDNFIVDFYCKKLRLAIEVDVVSHDSDKAYHLDKVRQSQLENLGISFLRFTDEEVKKNMEGVLNEIKCWIQPTPKSPPLEGTFFEYGRGIQC